MSMDNGLKMERVGREKIIQKMPEISEGKIWRSIISQELSLQVTETYPKLA